MGIVLIRSDTGVLKLCRIEPISVNMALSRAPLRCRPQAPIVPSLPPFDLPKVKMDLPSFDGDRVKARSFGNSLMRLYESLGWMFTNLKNIYLPTTLKGPAKEWFEIVSGVQERDHTQKRGALFPLQPPVTGVNRQDISKQLAPTHQLELDGGKMPTAGMLSGLEDDEKILSSGVGPLPDVSFPTPTLWSLHSLSRTGRHVTIGKGPGTDPGATI
uniref:Uncharacterized protein n=1 Tax=Chromera velia CCMP2878 TaxID=1169474 RepID=A0A0G4HZ58_9ALVE|eukprot:Cvel_9648.t1-p1 / transcript=Cvel_9648.t1 / gene=Cvel_9648 / organism=Chromera_velia_CCMP2878 / gene_product=hypothetical protein / transcript_product=hypothetical protein / location=Cvel_scaffold561:49580-50750(+) / protein_length=214 / sequence_SO=supercontig / SO=protein_coding / is_pseudo=false